MGRFLSLALSFWLVVPSEGATVADGGCERHLEQAWVYATAFLQRVGQTTSSENLNGPHSDKIRLEIRGVPYWVSRHPFPERLKLRHYVGAGKVGEANLRGPDLAEHILATQRLMAGPTPYVRTDDPPQWFRETYLDLTGVFLTTRTQSAEAVGVLPLDYVEIELLPGTPVIELEKDRIYLIPGPPDQLVVPVRAFR